MASFSLEINSFLKELKCPYKQINENSPLNLNERFLSRENKLLLLTYLCSELEAASMIAVNKPVIAAAAPTQVAVSIKKTTLKRLIINSN
jgi:hypothetical protein